MGDCGPAQSRRAKIVRSAGGVVFRRTPDGIRFLLIRDPYKNWGLPKGHIEDGESSAAAALREIAEETGLSVNLVAELPSIDWFFRDRGRLIHKFCEFYLLESLSGDARPQLDEGISECVWLPYRDAEQTLTYDNARGVLRAAAKAVGE